MTYDTKLQHLEEHGYVVFRNFLDRENTAAVRAQLDALCGPVLPAEVATTQRRLHVKRHPIEADLMPRLLARPELLDLAEALLGVTDRTRLRVLEQVLIRTDPSPPPHGPGGWHVDMAFLPEHYHARPRQTYYHMVHLCNTVAPGGGAFMIVPGSHKTSYAFTADFDRIDDPDAMRARVIKEAGINPADGIEVHGEEGDLLVFNPMALHSASGNATTQPRYVYFASFFDASATYLQDALNAKKVRDDFPDSLRRGLPESLQGLLAK